MMGPKLRSEEFTTSELFRTAKLSHGTAIARQGLKRSLIPCVASLLQDGRWASISTRLLVWISLTPPFPPALLPRHCGTSLVSTFIVDRTQSTNYSTQAPNGSFAFQSVLCC